MNDRGKARPDPELRNYIEKSRSSSRVAVDPKLLGDQLPFLESWFLCSWKNYLRRRLVFPEGIVVKAGDLDIASVMGMGFPPYRGGIMFWPDSIGSKYIYSRLEEWSKANGEFFKPCAFLAERAANGALLSSPVEQAKSRL
ncbi:Peroxisomal fatty acid beta-oxidation multifunctional protein mfp2 [Turnera subulata]|uniref:Peroxisomal fatty acid beta-oxidation multifunctional protein mfp2 n=1 Tax=Turnera subulata TaxID=218843 RepID=A0A9Q0F195_9ROSI|nr:Peroxisomal fatty acid beta-oxidation multifunctional protein mfp2 [Turnera subulata]